MEELFLREKDLLKYRVYCLTENKDDETENSYIKYVIAFTFTENEANAICEALADIYTDDFKYEEV